ncbi:MAG: gfo/Idh/MocA family oxidoreductase [Candidatus Latescibacteria bacterium]|nr:gfo/Idh/MocA family oxidoreductase [Candidatus Latescibacterota bacterium]
MSKYRVAIIGTGMIANAGHIPAWLDLAPQVELVGVYNHTLEKAQQTAQRHGIAQAYDDCQGMLDELQPDIVSVCTPNVSHRAYTEAALQTGAHVFCEKPVAASHADAVAMYETAETAGRHLFVTQTGRFSGANTAAKEWAQAGHLGQMYYAETSAFRRRGVPTWGRFHIRGDSGGGPLYDIGVHALDALLWIMGNPKVVAATGMTYTKLADQREDLVTSLADSGAPIGLFEPRTYDTGEYNVEDMAAGFLRLENDATISIRASWAANVPDGTGGTLLMGTKGGLSFNPLTFIGTLGRYQVDATPKIPADPEVPFYGHWKAAAHFIDVLEGRAELLVRREEVLNVMAALDGLYRSAAEKREINLV